MTIADSIINRLVNAYCDYTPRELATYLGLNPNSVRRTTQELAKAGEIVAVGRYRGAPTYRIAPRLSPMGLPTKPNTPRACNG